MLRVPCIMLRAAVGAIPTPTRLGAPLSAPKVTQAIQYTVPHWSFRASGASAIHRTFLFTDFKQALSFMNRVGVECDNMNHHPAWRNVYNRVDVELCTHDAGNQVTMLDIQLAAFMDKVYEDMQRVDS